MTSAQHNSDNAAGHSPSQVWKPATVSGTVPVEANKDARENKVSSKGYGEDRSVKKKKKKKKR